jgi:hypothetical protein
MRHFVSEQRRSENNKYKSTLLLLFMIRFILNNKRILVTPEATMRAESSGVQMMARALRRESSKNAPESNQRAGVSIA